MRRAWLAAIIAAAAAADGATNAPGGTPRRATDAPATSHVGRDWLPADEYSSLHPDASKLDPRERMTLELNRSVALIRPRNSVADTAELVRAMLLTSSGRTPPVFVLGGKFFAPPTFDGEKEHGLIRLLASVQRLRGILPNVAVAQPRVGTDRAIRRVGPMTHSGVCDRRFANAGDDNQFHGRWRRQERRLLPDARHCEETRLRATGGPAYSQSVLQSKTRWHWRARGVEI